MKRLEELLEVRFSRPEVLDLALTHRRHNNERLEFLGDSILNHVIAEHLYKSHPDASEGELSRMRASLVKGEALASLARQLHLGEWVRLGPGELKSGGHRRSSILADTLEAVIGAILLDAGTDVVRARVLSWYGELMGSVNPETAAKDAKTSLQEYLQGRGLPLPDYRLARGEGEDHRQEFHVDCVIPELKVTAQGRGSSRRRAEQDAAAAALEALDA